MPTLIAEGERRHVVIMGAGPAGLTAAYELMKRGVPVTVVERDPRQVGGLARTVEHDGYRFDIGGHRFFSKNDEVEELWTEILGPEMLNRGRLSRIYYRGRFFAYPIQAVNALWNLGPVEAVLCLASYLRARVFPIKDPRTLEEWVRNQFGWRLYSIFFKTYTEKVWGISTKELSADWAAQRIKSLDLWVVIRSALLPKRKPRKRGEIVTTLIDKFRYPRLGPGQMWERVAEIAAAKGHPVLLGQSVTSIRHVGDAVTAVVTTDTAGRTQTHTGTDFISSIPMRELVGRGRIQNFKNWSPDMVPDQSKTCLGLEYFCFEGDGMWTMPDDQLIELAKKELDQLGMCSPGDVFGGVVVRQQKAYPVYDDQYQAHVAVVRGYLATSLPNLHLAGRNGMHKYNNQDHSMMTALLVARSIAAGSSLDPWKVNADAVYHEDIRVGDRDPSGRQVPQRVAAKT